MQVIERVEGFRETSFDQVDERHSKRTVLECGERLVIGTAAESPKDERRYSWLEDCLERLEGKEARREYYARLERAAPW